MSATNELQLQPGPSGMQKSRPFLPPVLSRGKKILQMSLQRTGKALIDGSHDQDQIDSDVNFENEEFYENITEEDDSMPDGTELYATETTVVIDSGEVKIKFFVYVGVF
jgi:hypothetical protein